MAVTLKQLTYFQALAKEGHFGRAAEKVHVSQPALSVQIRDLEANLGGLLVERGPRGVLLTGLGRQVLVIGESILHQVSEMGQLAKWQGGLSGTLRLGVIPTIAPYLLPAALPKLRAQNIQLDLGVRESETEKLLEELKAGLLDAAIVALPTGVDGLVERPLITDRFLLAGTKQALADLADRIPNLVPDSLNPEALLLLEDGHCLTDQALSVCAIDPSAARMDMRASSLTTLCRLVAEGFGLTLLPELACRLECAAVSGLSVCRFKAPEPARQIGLVRRELSVDDGWFEGLADLLSQAAFLEIDYARTNVA